MHADADALERVLAERLEAEAWQEARDVVRELRFLTKVAGDIDAAIAADEV